MKEATAGRSSTSQGARTLALPFPWLLALRYLRSTRRDAFASFLSLVAAGGIALGVAALILALAMLSGLQDALKSEVLGRTPQIEVELPPGAPAEEARRVTAAVPGVISAQRLIKGRGWVMMGGGVEPVLLVGYEETLPATFGRRAEAEEGSGGGEAAGLDPVGLYLSESLARRWLIDPQDPVEIVSPRPTLTPFGPQPRIRTLPLAGVYPGSKTDEEQLAALPLPVAASLLSGSGEMLEVEVEGGHEAAPETAEALAAALARELPEAEATVRSWREINRPLLFALALEKALTFVAISLVVVVASLALIADLALIIAAKRPEIGILGAMGASAQAIRRAFLLLGVLLAGMGVVLGGGLGVGAAYLLDRMELLAVPGEVYFLDHVPFQVAWEDLAAVFLLTVLLVVSSSLYAARRATQLTPVDAMRR